MKPDPVRVNVVRVGLARSEFGNENPRLTIEVPRRTEFRRLRATALRIAADVEEALLGRLGGHAGYCAETKIDCDEHGGMASVTVELAEGADVDAVLEALRSVMAQVPR